MSWPLSHGIVEKISGRKLWKDYLTWLSVPPCEGNARRWAQSGLLVAPLHWGSVQNPTTRGTGGKSVLSPWARCPKVPVNSK